MQLATMLSVNSGITDIVIPWTMPMATPRKLKAMMIWRNWERQQCFKCLQPSGFDGTDNAQFSCSQLLTKTGCGCSDWAVTEGKVPGLGLQERADMECSAYLLRDRALVTQRFLCSSTSQEIFKYGTVTTRNLFGNCNPRAACPCSLTAIPLPHPCWFTEGTGAP